MEGNNSSGTAIALRFVALLATGLVVVACSACTSKQASSGLNIAEAKSYAQQMEDRIAALVPAEYVESSDQAVTGGLLSCGPDSYSWYGHTDVTLKGNPDFRRTLEAIKTGLKLDERYVVKIGTLRDGTRDIDVSGPYYARYIGAPSVNEKQFHIESFSPCFEFPEGVLPPDRY